MIQWLTADLHLFHRNIIRYCGRPHSSVEEMNDAIVRNWQEKVGPEDTIYVLGDFAFTKEREYEVDKVFRRLNGTKILVRGSHDKGFVLKLPWYDIIQGHIIVDGVVLVHDGDEFLRNNPSYKEKPVFAAHVHELWKWKPPILNVGVDVNHFRPVEFEAAKRYWNYRWEYYQNQLTKLAERSTTNIYNWQHHQNA